MMDGGESGKTILLELGEVDKRLGMIRWKSIIQMRIVALIVCIIILLSSTPVFGFHWIFLLLVPLIFLFSEWLNWQNCKQTGRVRVFENSIEITYGPLWKFLRKSGNKTIARNEVSSIDLVYEDSNKDTYWLKTQEPIGLTIQTVSGKYLTISGRSPSSILQMNKILSDWVSDNQLSIDYSETPSSEFVIIENNVLRLRARLLITLFFFSVFFIILSIFPFKILNKSTLDIYDLMVVSMFVFLLLFLLGIISFSILYFLIKYPVKYYIREDGFTIEFSLRKKKEYSWKDLQALKIIIPSRAKGNQISYGRIKIDGYIWYKIVSHNIAIELKDRYREIMGEYPSENA